MPTRGRQLGLVLLLLGLPALTLGPSEVGTIRLAGVSLAWWYVTLLAPILSMLITLLATLREHSPLRLPADRTSRLRDRASALLRRSASRSARSAPGSPPPGRRPGRSGRATLDVRRATSDATGPERNRGQADAGGEGTRRLPPGPSGIASRAR